MKNLTLAFILLTCGMKALVAAVVLTDANGTTRTAVTTAFGNYRFESVTQNENYTIAVSSRKFSFTSRRNP